MVFYSSILQILFYLIKTKELHQPIYFFLISYLQTNQSNILNHINYSYLQKVFWLNILLISDFTVSLSTDFMFIPNIFKLHICFLLNFVTNIINIFFIKFWYFWILNGHLWPKFFIFETHCCLYFIWWRCHTTLVSGGIFK